MDAIFMNSRNSTLFDPHRLVLKLLLYMEKYKNSHAKIINLKYQLQHRIKCLNYLIG